LEFATSLERFILHDGRVNKKSIEKSILARVNLELNLSYDQKLIFLHKLISFIHNHEIKKTVQKILLKEKLNCAVRSARRKGERYVQDAINMWRNAPITTSLQKDVYQEYITNDELYLYG
jgi:hypothetical protein